MQEDSYEDYGALYAYTRSENAKKAYMHVSMLINTSKQRGNESLLCYVAYTGQCHKSIAKRTMKRVWNEK